MAEELVLVAAVSWELAASNNNNGETETRSSKLRVYQSDLPQDNTRSAVTVRGRDLERLVKREAQRQGMCNTIQIEIYDPELSTYISRDELLEEDVVQRFGSRLRIHVAALPPPTTSTDNASNNALAIMGRFYSYEETQGITIAGQQVKVQEIPNQQNAGTGVNVWDGALLL